MNTKDLFPLIGLHVVVDELSLGSLVKALELLRVSPSCTLVERVHVDQFLAGIRPVLARLEEHSLHAMRDHSSQVQA